MPDDALAGAVDWDDQGSRATKPRRATGTNRGSVQLPGWLFRSLSSVRSSLRSLSSSSLENAGSDDNDDEPSWLIQSATHELLAVPPRRRTMLAPRDGKEHVDKEMPSWLLQADTELAPSAMNSYCRIRQLIGSLLIALGISLLGGDHPVWIHVCAVVETSDLLPVVLRVGRRRQPRVLPRPPSAESPLETLQNALRSIPARALTVACQTPLTVVVAACMACVSRGVALEAAVALGILAVVVEPDQLEPGRM